MPDCSEILIECLLYHQGPVRKTETTLGIKKKKKKTNLAAPQGI